MYKRELICAGVVAGVAILFTSPLAGFLFAMEVIARKMRPSLIISCAAAALISFAFIQLFDNQTIFNTPVTNWTCAAVPFFILLSISGGHLSVYFHMLDTSTRPVIGRIYNNYIRV